MFNSKDIKELYERTDALSGILLKTVKNYENIFNIIKDIQAEHAKRLNALEDYLGVTYTGKEETKSFKGYVKNDLPKPTVEKQEPVTVGNEIHVPRKYNQTGKYSTYKSKLGRKSPVHVTPEIRVLHQSGMPLKAIAKRTGVSIATVGRHYKVR